MKYIELGRQIKEVIPKEINLSKENVSSYRLLMHEWRESIVYGPVVIAAAPKLARIAEEKELWVDAAEFWNERALVADQYFRGLRDLPLSIPFHNKAIDEVKKLLFESVDNARKTIEEHSDFPGMNITAARQGLFFGKIYLIKGEYSEAVEVLDKSIKALSETQQPENAIELKGFKAEALVMGGFLQEGIQLAFLTYDEYETDENTIRLRDQIDYNRWVIWRAGCILKLAGSLRDTNSLHALNSEQSEKLVISLKEVYKLGTSEDVKYFDIRRKQLERVWKDLKTEGFLEGELNSD